MLYMAGTFMFFESKSGESKCHFLITFIIKYKKTVDQEKHPVLIKHNKKSGNIRGICFYSKFLMTVTIYFVHIRVNLINQ